MGHNHASSSSRVSLPDARRVEDGILLPRQHHSERIATQVESSRTQAELSGRRGDSGSGKSAAGLASIFSGAANPIPTPTSLKRARSSQENASHSGEGKGLEDKDQEEDQDEVIYGGSGKIASSSKIRRPESQSAQQQNKDRADSGGVSKKQNGVEAVSKGASTMKREEKKPRINPLTANQP
jgi:hypothetical protein